MEGWTQALARRLKEIEEGDAAVDGAVQKGASIVSSKETEGNSYEGVGEDGARRGRAESNGEMGNYVGKRGSAGDDSRVIRNSAIERSSIDTFALEEIETDDEGDGGGPGADGAGGNRKGKGRRDTNGSELPRRRPKWVEDDAYSACMHCQFEFTLFNRRHHCRHCGLLLCDECTSTMIALPHLKYPEPVRVCMTCVDKYFRNAPKSRADDGGCVIS